MATNRTVKQTRHHHDWKRRVVATEPHPYDATSMWGRPIEIEGVICHAEYVCETCGATRDGGACICDREKGDVCPPRVEFLEAKTAG